MFPNDFYDYLKSTTLIGIKGGLARPTFLDIWMVTVEKRVFARTWTKSARSWFTVFEEQGVGELKYSDKCIKVKGQKLPHDSDLHEQINQAYLAKYTQEHNLKYAHGITQVEYVDYTMEFFFTGEIH